MPLNIGIIGFGWMARTHVERARLVNGVHFICAYDIDKEKLKTHCAMYDLDICESQETLLARKDINMVLVATPNNWHASIAIAAAKAGKNVMVEKPATLSVAEWDLMEAAAKENGVFLTVHQNRRWDNDFRMVKKIIEDGTLGTIHSVESRVLSQGGPMFGWRGLKEFGGGMFFDWGVHLVDQLLWLYERNKIIDVKAQLMHVLGQEVDDMFQVILTLEDGPVLTIEAGSFCFRPLPRWHVLGSGGTMELTNFVAINGMGKQEGGITIPTFEETGEEDTMVVMTTAGPTRMMAPKPPATRKEISLPPIDYQWMLPLYENLVDVIEGRTAEPIVTVKQARRVLQCMELVFKSAECGHSIPCRL